MANAPGRSTSWFDSIRAGARNLARRFHRDAVERGNPRGITEVLRDPDPRRYLDPAVLDKFALSPRKVSASERGCPKWELITSR